MVEGRCSSARQLQYYQAQQQSNDSVTLKWGDNLQQSFQVGVELHINNQRGALATTSVIVANEHADVQDLNIKIIDEHEALIRLVLLVKQSVQLHRIIRMLDRQPCVYRVARFAMNDLNPVAKNYLQASTCHNQWYPG